MNLCRLVDQLASEKPFVKNHVVNEIKPSVLADTSEEMLKLVLDYLLDHITQCAKAESVRISAKTFQSIVMVQMKFNDPRKQCDIDKNFVEIKTILNQLGGVLYVNGSKTDETTISVTFLDRQLPRVA